jgi:hypothetical protein
MIGPLCFRGRSYSLRLQWVVKTLQGTRCIPSSKVRLKRMYLGVIPHPTHLPCSREVGTCERAAVSMDKDNSFCADHGLSRRFGISGQEVESRADHRFFFPGTNIVQTEPPSSFGGETAGVSEIVQHGFALVANDHFRCAGFLSSANHVRNFTMINPGKTAKHGMRENPNTRQNEEA